MKQLIIFTKPNPLYALILFFFHFALFAQESVVEDNPGVIVIDKSEIEGPDEDGVFMVVEKLPEFPGGDMELMKFIGKNIVYPEVARRNNIEGRVIVKFVIRKDGSVTDVEVLRDIGGGCGEEAKRVLELSPKWEPGIQDGENVDVYFTMPVQYKLESGGKKKKWKKKKRKKG